MNSSVSQSKYRHLLSIYFVCNIILDMRFLHFTQYWDYIQGSISLSMKQNKNRPEEYLWIFHYDLCAQFFFAKHHCSRALFFKTKCNLYHQIRQTDYFSQVIISLGNCYYVHKHEIFAFPPLVCFCVILVLLFCFAWNFHIDHNRDAIEQFTNAVWFPVTQASFVLRGWK